MKIIQSFLNLETFETLALKTGTLCQVWHEAIRCI